MTRFGISTTAAALIVGGVISMVLIGCSRSTTLSEGPEGSQAKAGVETPAVDQNEGAGKGMAALRQASSVRQVPLRLFLQGRRRTDDCHAQGI